MGQYERLDVDSEPVDLQKAGGKHSGEIGSECTVLTKEFEKQQTKTTKSKLHKDKDKKMMT